MIVLVVVGKYVHIKIRLGTVTKTGLLESADITQIFVCGVGRRETFTKEKVDTPDELLPRILDDAASVKKCEDQLGRTAQDLRTGVSKCTEVDGGVFEYLL